MLLGAQSELGSKGKASTEVPLKTDAKTRMQITKMLKDEGGQPTAPKGRRYDPQRALQPGGISLEDLILGMKLAGLAYTDDKPGTVEGYARNGPSGLAEVVEMTAGGDRDGGRQPLTELLRGLGYTCDRIFSHHKITGSLQAVDTQGYIAHNDTDVILAYRGSVGGIDWLTNLSVTTTEFEPAVDKAQGHAGLFHLCQGRCGAPKPRVQRGWYTAMLVTAADIKEVLLPLLKGPQPKRLIVCGHSLGGALASMAFAFMLKEIDWATSPHKIFLVSAGAPRIGDDHFKAWMDEEVEKLRKLDKCYVARIVHHCDVVPTVPLEMMGFCHTQRLCFLTGADLIINPTVKDFEDVGPSPGSDGWLPEFLDDHSPDNYLDRLLRLKIQA